MLKIALIQMKVIPGHPDINTEKMLHFIDEAKKQNSDIIIFPQLAISGDMLGDMWNQPTFLKDCENFGQDIIKSSENTTVIFGNIATDWSKKNKAGQLRKFNSIFIAQNGKFIDRDDPAAPINLSIGGKNYNIGCVICDEDFGDTFGFSPIRLTKNALDFCVIFSSSPFSIGKDKMRDKIFSDQVKVVKCPIVYSNVVGVQNKGKTIYTFDGGSAVYNSKGKAVIRTQPHEESMTIFELDKIKSMPSIAESANKLTKAESMEPEIASIYNALYHGVKDFMSQIGMKKIVIGISGGIDSAVDAALYTKVLGPENVLLVNMPSVFNSTTTRGLSEQLAKNLGCNYMVVPIQNSVDRTVEQIESTPMTFLKDNTDHQVVISSFVRENIQARDRSARVLATLAAAFGGGFTCNANKAESTVGYATMYGDSAGVVSALADLWKYQVYALAYHFNEVVYGHEVIPQGIIDIVPSAELSTAQNVDEGKGDPLKYPYHDYLFRAFVEKLATPEEILNWYADSSIEEKIGCERGLVKKYFATAEDFIADLERWWNLFTGIAVAKRIQSPPIIAVTRHAFGSDFHESQNGPYYTRNYKILKERLTLNKN